MKKVFYYFVITAMFACGSYIQSCSGEDFDEPWQDPEFETRAVRTRSGNELLDFPSGNTISKSEAVISQMNAAWERTKNACTQSGRKEFGFYIYFDRITGAITCGAIGEGPNVLCGQEASITLPPPTNSSTVCSMFHTHTSLEYCDINLSRPAGPSSVDSAGADQCKRPELLYDYETTEVWGGNPKTDPHKLYIYGSYTRRPSDDN